MSLRRIYALLSPSPYLPTILPIPTPPMPIVIILPLNNPLIIPTPRLSYRRWRDHGRRWQSFLRGLTLHFVTLPLDFADAFAALAPDVFGCFHEAEDVFLLGLLVSQTSVRREVVGHIRSAGRP